MTERILREVSLIVPPDVAFFFESWVAPRVRQEANIALNVVPHPDPSVDDLQEVDLAAVSPQRIEELLELGRSPGLAACGDVLAASGFETRQIGDRHVGLRFVPFRSDMVLISSDFGADEVHIRQSLLDLVRVSAAALELACTASPPPEGKVCPEAVRLFTHPSCSEENLPPGAPCPPNKILPPWFPKLKCFFVLEDRPGCVHSTTYNCLAWVLGRTDSFVWPASCTTVAELQLFLQGFGWTPTTSPDPECKKRKVAIFGHTRTEGNCHAYRDVAEGTPLDLAFHVALETYDGGWWTSKLGQSFRIVHRLHELEGHLFGRVLAVLKKSDETANRALCSPFPDVPRR